MNPDERPRQIAGAFLYSPKLFIMVRAKFTLDSIQEQEGISKLFNFSAVTNGSAENESFAKHTPFGQLQMVIDAETPAAKYFEVGKAYFLNFTLAEEQE